MCHITDVPLVAQAADVPTMPWSGSDIKIKVPEEFVEVSFCELG